jgi:nitroreductase
MSEHDPGLFETIYTSRALRRFKPDPIPDEVLFQVMDAAIRAPSGQNKQDWRFVVVTDPETKQYLQDNAERAWRRYQPEYAQHPEKMDELPRTKRLSLRSVEHLSHHLAGVPAIIFVCGLSGAHSTPGGSQFPAVQNLLLSARALGLGGSIFNLCIGDRDATKKILGIPDNNDIYCVLPIGYPTDRQGPVRRKPVKDVVFMNRFGQTWDFAAEQPETGWQDRWISQP